MRFLYNLLGKCTPHLIPFAVFLVAVSLFFYPSMFQGKELSGADSYQYRATVNKYREYQKEHKEEGYEQPLWEYGMFSGMPNVFLHRLYDGFYITDYVNTFLYYLSQIIYPNSTIAFIGFYLLLLSFKIRPLIAGLGSLSFTFSTYMLIGILAGHNTRIWAIAFMPFVLAGIHHIIKGNYKWGFFLSVFGAIYNIKFNHLQMTYYLFFVILIFLVFKTVDAIKQKDPFIIKKLSVIVLAGLLAVGCNIGFLYDVYSYSKKTIRGERILEPKNAEESKSGLDKSYAFEYSNDILEPLVLFIPNFYGGSQSEKLGKNSALAQALKDRGLNQNQIEAQLRSVPTYWGNQRITSPYYVGAIMVFLAILGILVLDNKTKYWLVATLVISIMLTWGDNFKMLNYFLFDYFPFYNKFRSVTFITLFAILSICILGSLALEKLLSDPNKQLEKKLILTLTITGSFLLLVLAYSVIGNFSSPIDDTLQAQQMPLWYLEALRDSRAEMLRSDTLRTAIFVLLSFVIVWMIMKKRLHVKKGVILLLFLVLVDIVMVGKRYLKADVFTKPNTSENNQQFKPTPADVQILKDTTDYRVINLRNPFNDNLVMAFHQTAGGYSAAKLRRYQDMIEYHISPENSQLIQSLQATGQADFTHFGVLNMLNVKYFIYGDEANNYIVNPQTNGNAWFVQHVKKLNSPQEVIDTLAVINTKTTALINIQTYPKAHTLKGGEGTIQLLDKDYNKLTYEVNATKGGLAVFSEVYYHNWEAYIDGNETEVFRINYILRGVDIPKGNHTIKFKYVNHALKVGNYVMLGSSVLTLVICILFFVFPRKKKSEKKS